MTTNSSDQRVYDEFETAHEPTPERIANREKVLRMYAKIVAGDVRKIVVPTKERVYAGK
jgi:hypothetical protein